MILEPNEVRDGGWRYTDFGSGEVLDLEHEEGPIPPDPRR